MGDDNTRKNKDTNEMKLEVEQRSLKLERAREFVYRGVLLTEKGGKEMRIKSKTKQQAL